MLTAKELAAELKIAVKEIGDQRVYFQMPDAHGNWYDVDIIKVLVDPERKVICIKPEGDAIIDPQYHHSIDDVEVDEEGGDW